MRIELHPEADAELVQYAEYYEQLVPGLGGRFLDRVEHAFAMLAAQPLAGRIQDESHRGFVLDEFPFTLSYAPESERIWITAIAHQHRRPDHWRSRER